MQGSTLLNPEALNDEGVPTEIFLVWRRASSSWTTDTLTNAGFSFSKEAAEAYVAELNTPWLVAYEKSVAVLRASHEAFQAKTASWNKTAVSVPYEPLTYEAFLENALAQDSHIGSFYVVKREMLAVSKVPVLDETSDSVGE